MGGFEAWAQTIGGILAFAGVTGFLENMAQFHDAADLESAGVGGIPYGLG